RAPVRSHGLCARSRLAHGRDSRCQPFFSRKAARAEADLAPPAGIGLSSSQSPARFEYIRFHSLSVFLLKQCIGGCNRPLRLPIMVFCSVPAPDPPLYDKPMTFTKFSFTFPRLSFLAAGSALALAPPLGSTQDARPLPGA